MQQKRSQKVAHLADPFHVVEVDLKAHAVDDDTLDPAVGHKMLTWSE